MKRTLKYYCPGCGVQITRLDGRTCQTCSKDTINYPECVTGNSDAVSAGVDGTSIPTTLYSPVKSLFMDVLTGQLGVPQWIEDLCVYAPYVVVCIFGILMWYIGFTVDQPGELKLLP